MMDRTHSRVSDSGAQERGGDRRSSLTYPLAVAAIALLPLTACAGGEADPCADLPEDQTVPVAEADLTESFAAFVHGERDPEEDAQTVTLFSCAGTERSAAELENLYTGLFADAVDDREEWRSAPVAGRYILLVESIDPWPDGLDEQAVLRRTAMDLLGELAGPDASALAADYGTSTEDVDPDRVSRVEDDERRELYDLYALISLLGDPRPAQPGEVIEVITDDYAGDIDRFLAEEARTGTHRGVANRMNDNAAVIKRAATAN